MSLNQQKETTEQIWRELSDRLRQFVRARINFEADVDDILQTVYLRIHSHIDELQNVDRLESWVFQITRNAIIDHYRRKRGTTGNEWLNELESESPTENAAQEIAGCMSSLIKRLPEDQQKAVSMYELEGMSQKEIANQQSISLSGAKSRIQRGRKSLEAMLRACCEFQFDRRGNIVDYQSTNDTCCDGDCE